MRGGSPKASSRPAEIEPEIGAKNFEKIDPAR
jgi:hypothetical protein